MSKVHQICPICAACNTKQKGGYYMCCACRHKWRDVESSSVFDRITSSPDVLAEKLVYCLNSSSFRVIDSAGRLLAYENEVWGSTILPGGFWTEYEQAIAATVSRLKEVYQ